MVQVGFWGSFWEALGFIWEPWGVTFGALGVIFEILGFIFRFFYEKGDFHETIVKHS
jgi:hypothetical protein